MRLLTIAVVFLLALAGAGCGGDDEDSSADEDTITLETTTDDTTTDETTTDDDTTDDDLGGSLASEECQELVAAGAALGQAFSGMQTGDEIEESSEAFSEFADNAPDEIRSDLQFMAETYAAYAEAIEEIGLESGETPSPEQAAQLQQALGSIDFAEFTAAAQRFSTWASTNCQP